jgi:hypothetical protein|tara:strand:+ start:2083 stop:2430 length:348 start_codon:yes stop_codon:yes gene_type:complete
MSRSTHVSEESKKYLADIQEEERLLRGIRLSENNVIEMLIKRHRDDITQSGEITRDAVHLIASLRDEVRQLTEIVGSMRSKVQHLYQNSVTEFTEVKDEQGVVSQYIKRLEGEEI